MKQSLNLLTYNVLADPVDANIRAGKLLQIISDAKADIIALQEVAPWFAELLRREPWAKGYHSTLSEGESRAPGGLVIMSRLPIIDKKYVPLVGRQRRGFLLARVRLGDRTLCVGTVHLESPLKDGPTRARQLDTAFKMLAGSKDAILMGDFNFGDGEEPETARLEAAYADLWLALRPGEPGFTWNIEKSVMARRGSFPGERSRRLDRILLRSRSWRAASIHIIGDGPVAEGGPVFPSDHFGLTGRIVARPLQADGEKRTKTQRASTQGQ
jgi:endonuclease/exonuclease/phosphatase family metal-dependent hydrolase